MKIQIRNKRLLLFIFYVGSRIEEPIMSNSYDRVFLLFIFYVGSIIEEPIISNSYDRVLIV